MSDHRVAVLVLAVVTAGCVGPLPSGTADATGTASPSPVTPTAATPVVEPTPAPPDNPWRAERVVVAVGDAGGRNLTRLVAAALRYWADRMEHADYAVEFVLEPNASDPDLVVTLSDEVACRNHDDEALGCAPVLERGTRAHPPESVRIRAGYTDDTTVHALKHEFGHVLGIEHGEPPVEVMRPTYDRTARLPLPDATERALPWPSSTLSVFVAYPNATDDERRLYEAQIDHALGYYATGADGHVPANVSFRWTRNRSAADVRIVFGGRGACGADGGSCSERWGPDPDRDGAIEYYERATITLVGVDAEAVGWHVGYWLGFALGIESAEDLPPPFVDADYHDRRSDWWT